MDIVALKKSHAEAEGKPVVYQRTDFPQAGVAVDTKSSASEFYSDLKSWGRGKLGDILIRLMRARSAGVQLIYLVIDDQIVDNPDDWKYHTKMAHWKAWDDLRGLIEYTERTFGVHVVFCRRAHAVDALIRALQATAPTQTKTDAEQRIMDTMLLIYEMAQQRDLELKKELSSSDRLTEIALADHDTRIDRIQGKITKYGYDA